MAPTTPSLADRVTGPCGPGVVQRIEKLTDGRVSCIEIALERGGTHSVALGYYRRAYSLAPSSDLGADHDAAN